MGKKIAGALLLVCCGLWGCPSQSLYQRVDQRALSWKGETKGKSPSATVEGLASYLVKDLRSDEARARAIFRWVTAHISYDARGYFTGRYGKLSAASVLRRRKAVCEGYANLYLKLAQAAGLEVVKIHGLAKGAGGARGRSVNHAWNAVKIKGQWRLVDSTWGAGYLKGSRFVRRFMPHYFLTPPQQMIYTHFPKNPRWQLLENPISRAEFLSRVKVWPAYFINQLQLLSPQAGEIRARREATLWLQAPKDKHFMASLEHFGRRLRGRRYVRWQRVDGRVRFDVWFPYPGLYQISIYVGPRRYTRHQAAMRLRAVVRNGDKMPAIKPTLFRGCFRQGTSKAARCQVQSPPSAHLPLGKSSLLKLRIPGAKAARIKLHGKRYTMQATKPGLFQYLLTPQQIGKVTVYARFGRSRIWRGVARFTSF